MKVVNTICPVTISRRQLPVNYDPNHVQLFQHEFEKEIPKSDLLSFENVRVSAEGLIFKDHRILPESFAYAFELNDWKRRSILKFLATNYFLRRPRKIQEPVLWITDYWSTGYFHWLTDALTRLYVVRDRLDQLVLMLPSGLEKRDFVRTSLEVFGVKKFDFIRRDEVLLCSNLLMPTHTAPSGHFRDEVISGVRQKLLDAFGDSGYRGEGERIYISRRAAARRRLVNEEEIIPLLHKLGFQTIYAEELPFPDQVKVLSRARYVVSNHGAGLSNMLFMKDGARVLELRHVTDYVNNCYFVLASALKFDYLYQLCEPKPDQADSKPADQHSKPTDPHTADIVVDAEELEKNLTLLLSC